MSLPFVYQENAYPDFIDILFTAISALSVTGLSTLSIADTLSVPGIITLAAIMQLGALGVMTIGTFIWLFFGKKIGLKERRLIMTDQNQTTFAGMVRLIKQIVYVLFLIELIGFLVLGTYFLSYFPTAGEAYLHGFFQTISAVTNGGYDITGQSLHPFSHDYFVQIVNMLLIIFGAIGFPVLIEVKEYVTSLVKKHRTFRFTLFTKLTSLTFFILVIVGALMIFLLDMGGFFADKSWHETIFYALFQSVTSRSGGLSTMEISQLTEQNHLFMSFLMFIGASPSSVGGGIRTTTFALVVIFIFTYAKGGNKIRIFNREIYDNDIKKAVTVTLIAIILVFTSVLIISAMESFSLMEIIFEVTSAFGTVGLSLGITSELTALSKSILMVLMFIGRIGIVTLLILSKNNKNDSFHYPKEKLIIG
ncbi:Ktr system potassium transporter KtrD [Virgibacillus kimchii]